MTVVLMTAALGFVVLLVAAAIVVTVVLLLARQKRLRNENPRYAPPPTHPYRDPSSGDH